MSLSPDDRYSGSWLNRVVSACQAFTGALIDTDLERCRSAVKRFASDSPRARTLGQLLVQRMMMIDLASNLCRHLRNRYPPSLRAHVSFQAVSEAFLSDGRRGSDPVRQFVALAERWLSAPTSPHAALAATVKALIDERYPDHISARAIALRLGEHPARIDRAFRRVYGMSTHAYARGRRLEAATALLADPTTTIVEISRRVGYRSKKDLYAAIRKDSGLTPLELRRLITSR